jgi:hypothetical protein
LYEIEAFYLTSETKGKPTSIFTTRNCWILELSRNSDNKLNCAFTNKKETRELRFIKRKRPPTEKKGKSLDSVEAGDAGKMLHSDEMRKTSYFW